MSGMEPNPIFDIPSVDGTPSNGIYEYDRIWYTVERTEWSAIIGDKAIPEYIVKRIIEVDEHEERSLKLYHRQVSPRFGREILGAIKPSNKISPQYITELGTRHMRCVWCGAQLGQPRARKVGYHDGPEDNSCGKKMRAK